MSTPKHFDYCSAGCGKELKEALSKVITKKGLSYSEELLTYWSLLGCFYISFCLGITSTQILRKIQYDNDYKPAYLPLDCHECEEVCMLVTNGKDFTIMSLPGSGLIMNDMIIEIGLLREALDFLRDGQ